MQKAPGAEEDVDIPAGVVPLVARKLLQGWRPPPPPAELQVQRFVWGEDNDLSTYAKRLNIEGAGLEIACSPSPTMFDDAFIHQTLRNKPCKGEASDGFEFHAKHANVLRLMKGIYPFECCDWTLQKKNTIPIAWVACFDEGQPNLREKNLIVQHERGFLTGMRLEGRSNHYLIPSTLDEQCVYYIIESQGHHPLIGDVINCEFNALQFVFGRPLHIDVMYGVDATGSVVAYVGGPFGYGNLPHGGAGGADRPPIGYRRGYEWQAWFFSTIADAMIKADKQMVLRSIGYYLHSMKTDAIEPQAIELHVGAEALARDLLQRESKKAYKARHKEWQAWCDKHKQDIEDFAIPGQEGEFFKSVRNADQVGPSRVVKEAFAHLCLTIDAICEDSLNLRNKLVHQGYSPRRSDFDDDIAVTLDAPRTLLIALLAKAVGYSGPILGYSRSNPVSPLWWAEAESPPPGSARRYNLKLV